MKVSLSLIFLLILLSCNGSKSSGHQEISSADNPSNSKNEIIGRWKLFKVECCGRNKSTKLIDDESKYLKFNENGMVKFQDHGTLESKVPYSFETTMEDTYHNWIKIGDKPTAIYLIKGDTLILNWEYMDLQIEYYLKY